MGVCVLVLGASGTGKSTSLRNFKPEEIAVFNAAGKPLPFRGHLPKVDNPTYEVIKAGLMRNEYKAYVIDDATYLITFDFFRRAKEKGYEKFVDLALNFESLLKTAIHGTDPNTIVYFLMHNEPTADNTEKVKTIGKMLDEKLCIEGLFPIVLNTRVIDGQYLFITNSNGQNLAKSPIDMLPAEMDNDLKEVDCLIREYWNLAPTLPEKQATKKAAK